MLRKIDLPDESFIQGWYLEDTSVCDEILDYFNSQDEVLRGMIFHEGEHVVKPEWKDSYDLPLLPPDPPTSRYVKELDKVLDEYKKYYPLCNETGSWDLEWINIQHYPPGGGYSEWHTERSSGFEPAVYRHLVFMTFLNDVYEDGYTEFFYQKVAVRPRKGLTLIWPSDWTHTHRGVRAPKEHKYITTGWFSFTDRGNMLDKPS